MAKNSLPQFGLCIDWETSGATWGGDSSINNQGIAVGVVVFDVKTFEPVKTLYREIQFDANKYQWQAGAEKIHGLSRDHLATNGVTQEDAAIDVASLIVEFFDASKEILLLGHNVGFDISFTKQLLEPYGVMFKIHHVLLDTSGLGLVTMGQYRSNDLFDILGFEKRGEHNALDDALMTLGVCNRIKMLVNAGLGL